MKMSLREGMAVGP